MSKVEPYTGDLKLSDYNLNDLLPKIWEDGYQYRGSLLLYDISRRILIEMFKILELPLMFGMVYFLWVML